MKICYQMLYESSKQRKELYIGNNEKSFSKLVNNCIKLCKTDKFIFCNHRVTPTDYDIQRVVELLDAGYGYVGLYRFACFGIHMDILNKLGGFDENFIPGGCEDDDFKLRLQLNDIAFFEDHSVEYRAGESRWSVKEKDDSRKRYFDTKYQFDPATRKIKTTIELCKTIDHSKYIRFSKSIFIDAQTIYYLNEYWRYTL